ncbi:MAG TPA: SGNH/GDSL hydrolase family protein [Vicinamibacterales bacterium]|nr:SGNH/GDSL hydrolase family protein [Vicinamibacterales bacterium]
MVITTRRSIPLTCWTVVCGLALVLLSPALPAAQSRFSGIVVFGTSLSDSGNAFALVGDQSTPPDFTLNPLLVPSAPYAKGGHHFSNGATWIEQFGRSVGLDGAIRPALASNSSVATNFAVGAARAYADGINFNLTQQVDGFLQRSNGVASSQALYVIEMGSNDVRDSFAVYAAGGNGGPVLTQAIESIAHNIHRLYMAGARQFLIWVVPNIALTPAIRSLGPAAGALAGQLSMSFNAGLTGTLAQLTAMLPGVSFTRLDANQLLNAIVADPAAFNLTNVSSACVTANVVPFTCESPDEYLFWDGIHPTKAAHRLLAIEAAHVLE